MRHFPLDRLDRQVDELRNVRNLHLGERFDQAQEILLEQCFIQRIEMSVDEWVVLQLWGNESGTEKSAAL
jgi:hypothetical protein